MYYNLKEGDLIFLKVYATVGTPWDSFYRPCIFSYNLTDEVCTVFDFKRNCFIAVHNSMLLML